MVYSPKETIAVARKDEAVLVDLLKEYHALVHALHKRRDPTLELRLTVVMMDLGLYQPSPP